MLNLSMMNVIVTGAEGQLGSELRAASRNSANNYVFTDVCRLSGADTSYLDITDAASVKAFFLSRKADVIVNCAAYTNVDKAEDDAAAADLLNRQAVRNIALAAIDCGATVIHISTDYVFGGDGRVPYKENDAKNPLGVYGRTKLAGEEELLGSGCKAIIIRTAWLYSPYGKNFVKTMASLMATRQEVGVVADQVGSPTCAEDLAAFIYGIIETGMLGHTGVYHYTDAGVVSWFDFAREICRLGGWDCAVKPLRSSEFPSKVRRPHYSVLDKSKTAETFGVEVPYWKDSLARCLPKIK